MDQSFLGIVKQAFSQANTHRDCTFNFVMTEPYFAATPIAICMVEYVAGNEFVDLTELIKQLNAQGKVKTFDLHGRGNGNESTKIVIRMEAEGRDHQIHYILAPTSQ